MSFTSTVKNEVSKLEGQEIENISELSAIIRNIGSIKNNTIKITTENASVARRIFRLIKDIYGIRPKITVRKGYNFNKSYLYVLEVTSKIKYILEDLSILVDSMYMDVPQDYIIGDEGQLRAYLRGIFLSSGSINDPKTARYHLELIVDNNEYAKFISKLCNNYNLNSKFLKRDSRYMIYLKEAEKISDFLRIIDASNAVLYYEDIRIYRDTKNMTNRLNNCDQANIDKIIMTGNSQVEDIKIIEEIASFDLLDDKIKEVAIYRKKYPEASLLELSEIISFETNTKITKSGVNHRMKKIKELANKIRAKEHIEIIEIEEN